MYQRKKTLQVQFQSKMTSKYKDNGTILGLYTIILYKIKKFFLFFLKPRYNWYNLKKCYIPMLNCSNLYQECLVQSGTIGTIVKKARNCNSIGGHVHEFCFLFFHMLKGVYNEKT